MRFIVVVVALVAALGGLAFGFDTGIVATTLAHKSFRLYMFGPTGVNVSLTGAVVSSYNAGQCIGGMTMSYLADKISRKYTICFASVLAVIAGAIQCAAMSPGMLIAGRAIGGVACGQLLPIVPIYLSETAPPKNRGLLVGLQGLMITVGFALANWVGYAGSFASGNAQWRIPLGMQIPVPLVLAIGIIFCPFSPRWLIQQERYEEASKVLHYLHGSDNNDLASQEMIQIRQQLTLERMSTQGSTWAAYKTIFTRRYLRRSLLAIFIITMNQLSGASVIQNYQSIFYAAVGFTGQRSLLISGVYGLMGLFGQILYLILVADRWPRKLTLWSGSIVLSAMIGILMALTSQYASADANPAGARAAIAAIFLYSFTYAMLFNALTWVVPSEIMPMFLRSKALGVGMLVKGVVAIVLSQITPLALNDVGWRFYSFFIATNMAAAVVYVFLLPETGGKTLEEIAEVFGDSLATERVGNINVDEKNTEGEAAEMEDVRPSKV